MKQNVTLILVLVLAAVSAGAQDRDRCPEFSQLADRALSSSVGNADYTARLLKPEVGRQLGSAFDLEALQDAVKDQLRGEPDCCEAKGDRYVTSEREFRGEQDSRLRVDLERGKIVYLNRGRSHDVLSGPRFEIAACIPMGRPAGNFGVAPRKPASAVTHWNTFGNRRRD